MKTIEQIALEVAHSFDPLKWYTHEEYKAEFAHRLIAAIDAERGSAIQKSYRESFESAYSPNFDFTYGRHGYTSHETQYAYQLFRDGYLEALEQNSVPAIPEGWKPIETAPKNGAFILVGNTAGTWIATYDAFAPSGARWENPWRSMMLNHNHMKKRNHNWSSVPTHWMPLPAAPQPGEK